MDGSKRSAHANAYFTGFGAAKRVVFFDTLLHKLAPGEVEAVLAHELGHFKHRHVLKRIVGDVRAQPGRLRAARLAVDAGAGSTPGSGVRAVAWTRRTTRWRCCCSCWSRRCSASSSRRWSPRVSRRHEFEADAYACAHADGRDLAAALLKLHEDNASTLTPDPLYVRFYYSHPPAGERLAALPARRSSELDMTNLLQPRCQSEAPRRDGCAPRSATTSREVSGWTAARRRDREDLRASSNYHETIAFVNALAWICHTEDHHPDLRVTYDHCVVRFSTHSVGGISRNDFICAAKRRCPGVLRRLKRAGCRRERAVTRAASSTSAWSSPATAGTTSSRRPTASASSATRAARRATASSATGCAGRSSGDEGVIEQVEPRRNLLFRQDEWKTKSFAANLDQLLVLVAAEPVFSESQLARALIAAESAGIPARIVLNKTDLPAIAAARERLRALCAHGHRGARGGARRRDRTKPARC